MQDTKTVYPNDTTRAIERLIKHLNEWKVNNPSSNPRETALVITKLEEAAHWSLEMVKQTDK